MDAVTHETTYPDAIRDTSKDIIVNQAHHAALITKLGSSEVGLSLLSSVGPSSRMC